MHIAGERAWRTRGVICGAALLTLAMSAVAAPAPMETGIMSLPDPQTLVHDLSHLRPNGRLGYTVIPKPEPDTEMLTQPLIFDRWHHRGRACRAPVFPPTRVTRAVEGQGTVSVDSWWFEFSPEGLAHRHIAPGILEATGNIAREHALTEYRIGYVIYRWQGELRYHGWRTLVSHDGPIAYSTTFADLRARLGCEKVDLQYLVTPPVPYRRYGVFGIEHPDEAIRGLPALNTGTFGALCRRPDFAPTRHSAYGAPGGVDAWFFEYDPTTYAGFDRKFVEHNGTRDYRAGYVVFDWGGELRLNLWSTARGISGGGPMMHNALRADIAWRFGCLHLWNN